MNQDKLLELAKEAQLIHEFEGLWGVQLTNDINQLTPALTKFAELILASQAQPTPSQSVDEPYAYEAIYDNKTCALIYDDGELDPDNLEIWGDYELTPLYTKPQPTPSQSEQNQGEAVAIMEAISTMSKHLATTTPVYKQLKMLVSYDKIPVGTKLYTG